MQRQSIGSPASKLQINGGKEEKLEKEENRKDVEEDDEKKVDKHLRSSSRTQKSVHLIPVLTIFCFFVLYLVSHDPSQNDLANAGGFERHFRPKDLKEVSDVHRFFDMEKNQLLAIRSHRSLQEVGKGARKSRPLNRHRKLGVSRPDHRFLPSTCVNPLPARVMTATRAATHVIRPTT